MLGFSKSPYDPFILVASEKWPTLWLLFLVMRPYGSRGHLVFPHMFRY